MKIRIKGNSIRLRLTKSEVNGFIETGLILVTTQLVNQVFVYQLEESENLAQFSAKMYDNTMTVYMPTSYKHQWKADDKIGFTDKIVVDGEMFLTITVEKDFVCLDTRTDEDESDNYPNPKAGTL